MQILWPASLYMYACVYILMSIKLINRVTDDPWIIQYLPVQECEKWVFESCHSCPKEAPPSCSSSPYPQHFHDQQWQHIYRPLALLRQWSSATKTIRAFQGLFIFLSDKLFQIAGLIHVIHKLTKHITLTASSAALQATIVASISPVWPTMSLFGMLTRTCNKYHHYGALRYLQ